MTDHPGEAQVWAAHHQEMSRAAGEFARSVGAAFQALNRIQYRAPWRAMPRSSR